MDNGKGKVGILALLGGKPSGDDGGGDMSGGDGTMALKAAFRAIKDDDFDGFAEAMKEWQHCCSGDESAESESGSNDD